MVWVATETLFGGHVIRVLLRALSVLMIARLLFLPLLPPGQSMSRDSWIERFPLAYTLGIGVERLSRWFVVPAEAALRLAAKHDPKYQDWLPVASIPAWRARLAVSVRRHLPPVLARQFSDPDWDHVLPGYVDFAAASTWLLLVIVRGLQRVGKRPLAFPPPLEQERERRSSLDLFTRLLWRRGQIHSRRAFLDKLRYEFAEARAAEISVALLIIHLVAHDQAKASRLERICLRKLVRELPRGASWCRFEMGELAAWMPGYEHNQAMALADSLVSAGKKGLGLISIGLCHVPSSHRISDGLDHQAIIRIANEQLKRARSQGGGVCSNGAQWGAVA